ncbi:MAG: SRPBCC family protein [Thaumarchaeota archaeon]|nr:SRPBCC family protein [Nitrososphaerota archaeon]
MTECAASVRIRAPPARAFGVATAYDSLHDRLPRHYAMSRTRSRRGGVAVVQARMVVAGMEWSVMARHTEDAPRRHETAIIGGDGRGTTIVETYEGDGDTTVLTVRASIRRRGPLGVPLPVGRRGAQEWVSGLAAAIARAAES